MKQIERIRIVVTHLLSRGVATSQKGLGAILGYNNESSFSQILNGKVSIPKNFINRLAALDDDIREGWIESEDGLMLKSMETNSNNEPENLYFKGTKPDSGKESLKPKQMEQSLLELLKGSQAQTDRVIAQQGELISVIKNLTSGKNNHSSEVESEKKPRLGLVEGQESGELDLRK